MSYKRNARWALTIVAALIVAACGGAPAAQEEAAAPEATATTIPTAASVIEATAAPEPTAEPEAAGELVGAINGIQLPADAAPSEQQVYRAYFDSTATFTSVDFMVTVYEGGGNAIRDMTGEPLIRLNNNFQPMPAAALSWSSNADATEWTFNLDPNLVWSDGTPVTAADYVNTFQYAADQEHAWDFAWFFGAPGEIKNWSKVNAGEVPNDELGVKALDDKTVVFTTETPAPFFPAKALYSMPLQKAAFDKYGPYYNNDPATSVSCGPFVLKEWVVGEKVIWEANPNYTGSNKPYIQRIENIAAKPETFFIGYRNNDVDFVGGEFLGAAETEIINSDPELSQQTKVNAVDFRTDYLFFDTTTKPFDDVRVRQAFAKVIDRESIIANILGKTQAIPAYSFLMPGFHAANSEGLKPYQDFDPEGARALMEEAGYPNGEGFPDLELWLRNEPQIRQDAAQAIAASLKAELGVNVEVSNKEFKTFMEGINAKPTQIQFGMVSYGIDFFDASNMLGVWSCGGRHVWCNAEFDALVTEASASNDTAGRLAQFQEAEKMLVEEAAGAFLVHRINTSLLKPYIVGKALEPNAAGFNGIQWPGFNTLSDVPSSMYVNNTVCEIRDC